MRTPAGTECPYYYADFHRGHNRQECRLVGRTPGGGSWNPSLCSACRVPAIVLANACPYLVLEARVAPGFLGLGRHIRVSAACTQSGGEVAEPEVGCGMCHEWPAPPPDGPKGS